jgi:hypothetical protein
MKQFDDKRLVDLAKRYYYGHGKEPNSTVRTCFNKTDALNNDERNELLKFIEENMFVRPISMSQMKREILGFIGYKKDWTNNGGYSYGDNTVNRKELEAIYQWFMKQKSIDGTKKP